MMLRINQRTICKHTCSLRRSYINSAQSTKDRSQRAEASAYEPHVLDLNETEPTEARQYVTNEYSRSPDAAPAIRRTNTLDIIGRQSSPIVVHK